MLLLLVPLALVSVAGLLWLATVLEQRRTEVLVRLSVRSKATSPEDCEAIIAEELAPVLAARGLSNRPAA